MSNQIVHLEFDYKTAKKDLDDLQKEQLPFAFAKTLTRVAKIAQVNVQARTRQYFELNSEFIPRGIGIIPAKKSDIKSMGHASSSVITKDRISTFMPIHETGGIRNPSPFGGSHDKGRALAIPGKHLASRSYKTATGKIRKRWKPSTLLDKGRPHSKSRTRKTRNVTRGGRKGVPFIINGARSGVPMIVRRIGKKRYPLEILYVFTSKAKIPSGWRFEETVRSVANDLFESVFWYELAKAMQD